MAVVGPIARRRLETDATSLRTTPAGTKPSTPAPDDSCPAEPLAERTATADVGDPDGRRSGRRRSDPSATGDAGHRAAGHRASTRAVDRPPAGRPVTVPTPAPHDARATGDRLRHRR